MGWHGIPAKGSVGGIVILWIEYFVKCNDILKAEYSVSCLFKNCRGGLIWIFTGVHYRGSREDKDVLWKELGECKVKWDGNWIVSGDFNMVLGKGERSGNNTSSQRWMNLMMRCIGLKLLISLYLEVNRPGPIE